MEDLIEKEIALLREILTTLSREVTYLEKQHQQYRKEAFNERLSLKKQLSVLRKEKGSILKHLDKEEELSIDLQKEQIQALEEKIFLEWKKLQNPSLLNRELQLEKEKSSLSKKFVMTEEDPTYE